MRRSRGFTIRGDQLLATETSSQQVFARVAHETGLLGDTYQKRRSPTILISALCGIRSDRLDHTHLVLASRFLDYKPDVLLRALQERKTLVRTWGVRGALQTVPTSQLGLYLAAAGITAPRWRRFLDARSNLSTPARLRLLKRLCPEVISREALREAIPDGTTRLFMLREAAQAGHIVWQDGDAAQATFAWTENWLDREVEPEREYHDLVARYLTTYGPVNATDLAAWLGVTVAAARRLMAKHLVEEVQVEGDETPNFMKPDDLAALVKTRKSAAKGLVVVPPGDPFIIAYKTRYDVDGLSRDDTGLVFLDGRLAAGWTLGREAAHLTYRDGDEHARIRKAVQQLLERAGLEIPALDAPPPAAEAS
jgi:hypothetical protein